MSWRETFLIRVGPAVLSGITLGDWLKLLRENRYAIDSPYWGRAATITSSSIPNTVVRWWENLLYGRKVKDTAVTRPLFVLGIWRSGTTHVHNLLAVDERFAYPNFYQMLYPHTFLCTEATSAKFVSLFLPKTRPQDNVRLSPQEPAEDEIALCALACPSFLFSLVFPQRAEHYDRYLTFRGVAENDVAEWKAALTWFLKKLTFKYGRPLVLKSPGHTCRIKMLLELFPDAKFVHIHRNPYTIFQSTQHTAGKVLPYWTLQRPNFGDMDARIIRQYKELYEVFFEERSLVPTGRLHEVCFEELEKDPLGQVQRIYESLELPDFHEVRPALERYVASLAGYKKNTFPELPAHVRERIKREWRRCFDEWGYAE